jgi:hypothetical protein
MDAQTLTIISGVVLLIVFALVGLNMRRRSTRQKPRKHRRNK